MSDAQILHREAMRIASDAQFAYQSGDSDGYASLSLEAFFKEKEAAEQLLNKPEAEPTRSILYKGAAQLAFNSGEYLEAEKLICQALLGNPPLEIRQNLRELNLQTQEIIAAMSTVRTTGEPEYLLQLREQAIHILVQPKNLRHLSAVYVDSAIEVLRRIKDSFLSFVEIDFQKHFDLQSFKEPEKLMASLRREANPILVNLKFSSFAASISSDLVVMASQYSEEINVWKRDAFKRYRTDVFEMGDYETETGANKMSTPFSAAEKRRIFQPIIEIFKENNPYQVSLTDDKFREKKRSFQPVSKKIREILVPELPNDGEKAKELYQIFGMGDPESGGKISASDIIVKQALKSAELQYSLTDIRHEKDIIYLNEPLELSIRYEKPLFYLTFSPLQLELVADDFQKTIKDFQKSFVEIHHEFTAQKLENPSFEEAEILGFFQKNVFSSGKS